MNPSQVSLELIKISSAIKNSKHPDRQKVIAALHRVINRIASSYQLNPSSDKVTVIMDDGTSRDVSIYGNSNLDISKVINYPMVSVEVAIKRGMINDDYPFIGEDISEDGWGSCFDNSPYMWALEKGRYEKEDENDEDGELVFTPDDKVISILSGQSEQDLLGEGPFIQGILSTQMVEKIADDLKTK